jgi:integrase
MTPTYAVLWRDPSTRRQRSFAFEHKQDAVNFARILTENNHHLDAAVSITDAIAKRSPTIRAVVEEHITNTGKPNERTRADYRREAERHITPYIGSVTATELTPDRVRAWLRSLADTDLADKSIANVHGLLSAAMKSAVQRGHCAGNPCEGIALPRRSDHDAQEIRFLTVEEWKRVDAELGKVQDGRFQLLFRVLAGTGVRWGELAALRAGDFTLDTDPPTVRIIRAVKRDADMHAYVGVTKTKRGKRTVSITESLADQIREHIQGMAPMDPVFTMATGKPLHATNIRSRAWWPALKAAQIEPRPRIYDLRHSHASWQLAAGLDMFTLQRRMGHESIKTTTDVYGHVVPTQQKAAADAMIGIV